MKLQNSLILILVFQVLAFAQGEPKVHEASEPSKLNAEVVRLAEAGKYEEALAKGKIAVSVIETKLGSRDLLLGSAWRNLAIVEYRLLKYREAEGSFDRALDIFEANRPLPKTSEIVFAELLEAAASFDARDGKLAKAESRLRRAIEIRERINGLQSVESSIPKALLGRILHANRRYEDALDLLVQAYRIRKANNLGADQQVAVLRATAECTLGILGKSDEIEKIFPKKTKPDTDNTINSGVVNGKALVLAKPRYPADARQIRARGPVSVRILINEGGEVIFACPVSGEKVFYATTEYAAYQSKFSPTLLDGKPVKVSGLITYNFVP